MKKDNKDLKKEEKIIQIEDMVLDDLNLDIPNPPEEISYSDYMDYHYEQILIINNQSVSETGLVEILTSDKDIYLKAAAANTIGFKNYKNAISELRKNLSLTDDVQGVEIAYALYRLKSKESEAYLLSVLDLPLDAYFTQSIAAGHLAKMGNPIGFDLIKRILTDEQFVDSHMLACKQLYFFMPFQSEDKDVLSLFEVALQNSNTNLQWQALVQLRDLPATEAMKKILQRYVDNCEDAFLKETAQSITQK